MPKVRRKKARKRELTRHHDLNKCRGGKGKSDNIIWLKERKHTAWHQLFGHKTLSEATELLERLKQKRGS